MSTDISASTFSKSTRASSGSTRLTSLSLTALGAGLCAPLLGVVGVFGRESVPSDDFVGVVVPDLGRDFDLERDSVLKAALYFFVPLSAPGVADTGRRVKSPVDAEVESGRLVLNGTERAILLVTGVCGIDIAL